MVGRQEKASQMWRHAYSPVSWYAWPVVGTQQALVVVVAGGAGAKEDPANKKKYAYI